MVEWMRMACLNQSKPEKVRIKSAEGNSKSGVPFLSCLKGEILLPPYKKIFSLRFILHSKVLNGRSVVWSGHSKVVNVRSKAWNGKYIGAVGKNL